MGRSLISDRLEFPRRDAPAGRGLWHRFVDAARAPWRAWQERRRAAACCREVLRLDRLIAKGQPWLSPHERYAKVVAAYAGVEPPDARKLLVCAEASFASWPVRRDLTLRDVGHYLAVSELLRVRDAVQASLKPVIHATIPSGI